jgi:hypothetical protein
MKNLKQEAQHNAQRLFAITLAMMDEEGRHRWDDSLDGEITVRFCGDAGYNINPTFTVSTWLNYVRFALLTLMIKGLPVANAKERSLREGLHHLVGCWTAYVRKFEVQKNRESSARVALQSSH